MTDAKPDDPKTGESLEKGDLAKRLERLTDKIDDLEDRALPPKTDPADIGAIVGD